MGSLQNDIPNSQPVPTNVQQEASIYEDEINLVDYFRVLWKWKSIILLGAILPTLIVGLILFFSPRNYVVTYTYDVRDPSRYDVRDRSSADLSNWSLNEGDYNILLDKFYSEENLNKIVNKLGENNLDGYAKLIAGAERRQDLEKLVKFDVLPPFTDLSKATVTSLAQLEQIEQLKALLLNMTVIGGPKNDIPKISSVIRDNFENVIPAYMVEEHLNAATRRFRTQIADIEEERFNLELDLKINKSILARLKSMKTPVSDWGTSSIVLQYDIGGKAEYLPVGYQIQAVEAKTIQLEEENKANEDRLNYCQDLQALNEKLLAELNNKVSSYYTIQQFRSFLTSFIDGYEKKELKGYLNSYIKRIDSRISASTPVTEKPKVCAVSKDAAKKTTIVFVIMLVLSAFAAFLIEGLQKNKAQTS